MEKDTNVKPGSKSPQWSDPGGRSGEAAKPEPGRNKGEGNPEAAARFNQAEQDFVHSDRGQKKIREAGDVRPDEEAQLEEAERTTRSLPTDAPPKK